MACSGRRLAFRVKPGLLGLIVVHVMLAFAAGQNRTLKTGLRISAAAIEITKKVSSQ
jgi:hypothetical protein